MASNYGFKISLKNHEVLTAAPDKLVMSSAYYMNKINKTGYDSYADFGETVAHGLSYRPVLLVYQGAGSDMVWGRTGTGTNISNIKLSGADNQIIRYYCLFEAAKV